MVLPIDLTAIEPSLALALTAGFGSVERWRDEFVAMGASRVGPGRLQLAYVPGAGRLVNRWSGALAHPPSAGTPLLEFEVDDGRVPLAGIDWSDVLARYRAAVNAASEPFAMRAEALGDALLLDVRRAGAYEKAGTLIAGARWMDPATVGIWAAGLPAGRAVVVCCVHGHEVSRATALWLRAAGIDARFLDGGIDAWQASGRPMEAKPSPA